MKYRKKPVVVEAFKYSKLDLDKTIAVPRWWIDGCIKGVVFSDGVNDLIKTLEGDMKVSEGDYVIQGIKGELYPCKPDIFEATYEAA